MIQATASFLLVMALLAQANEINKGTVVSDIRVSNCAKTIVVNESTEVWNAEDQATLERATYKCAHDEAYADTPCLKNFYKREPRTYAAICSIEKGE